MQNDIRNKLQIHLLKNSFEESDVVYVLSRIRKLIEVDEYRTNNKKDYRELKFFCNWALHVKINDVPVKDLLMEVEQGKPTFEIYKLFCSELQKFLKNNNLQSSIFNSENTRMNFLGELGEVYKDTPLIVMDGKKELFTFTFTESDIGIDDSLGIPIHSFGSTFRIEPQSKE